MIRLGSFRDAPILRKLTVVVVATSAVAMMAFSVLLTARGWVDSRQRMVHELEAYAGVIGLNAATAVLFDDPQSATETLAALRTVPAIVGAAIYDKNGLIFAAYPEAMRQSLPPLAPPTGTHRFQGANLSLVRSILFKGDSLGSIYLQLDLHPAYLRIAEDTGIVFAMGTLTFLVAVLLMVRLQRRVVAPLKDLAQVMHTVSEDQDFTVRAGYRSRDEVGVLSRVFNGMLESIKTRDDELAQHRSHLEELVAQRTDELRRSNQRLEQELAERLRAEQALHDSEEMFRVMTTAALDAIVMVDADGVLRFWNAAAENLFGYRADEVLGRAAHEFLLDPTAQQRFQQVFRHLRSAADHAPYGRTLELTALDRSGAVLPVELSLSATTLEDRWVAIGILRDISERKRAEAFIRNLNEQLERKVEERTHQLISAQEELVRKEKLALLGQIAGSVAHELRNPLAVMSNAVYFLQAISQPLDETVAEYLGILSDEITNAERIVGELLDSVRTRAPNRQICDVAAVVEASLGKCPIPARVSVRTEIPEGLPPFRADPRQMQQVLRNLITNAVEAMPQDGRLTVKATGVEGGIELIVCDTGPGLSPELREKLFQPLFTTKARGIGLGLVVVKNLVEANGGRVEVVCVEGEGTTFVLHFPWSVDSAEEQDETAI